MVKKKTSQEHLESLQKEIVHEEHSGIKPYDPMKKLLDKNFTLSAIFECLSNGDVKGAKEVFKNYLWAVNKVKLAKKSHVSRSTIVHCLDHENPTMDTFFKLMSA